MKRILVITLLTFATASLAVAQTPDKSKPTGEKVAATSSAEQELTKLDRDLRDAAVRNDTALFARIATDDYTSTGPVGTVANKARAIEGAKNAKFESIDLSDVRVQDYGNAAVLTGRATVKGRAGEQDISGQYRYIRVFVKQDGQWRLAAFQVTSIAQQPQQQMQQQQPTPQKQP